jgi:hypothetical protein
MQPVGHASTEISQRYNHPLRQAHLTAASQVAALVSGSGKDAASGHAEGGQKPPRPIAPHEGIHAGQEGWGGWGSNPRPTDYESAALTG